MRIKVTQEHIDSGIRRSCESCPIALATGASHVSYFDIVLNSKMYETPVAARRFMGNFDLGRPVTPFEFELC